MEKNLNQETNRWFWIYVSNFVVSGLIAWACLTTPAHAAEHIVFDESEVEVSFPRSVPVAFQSFTEDVTLGAELEALEALEEEQVEGACAAFQAEPLVLASRSSR